ncbi:uncharacterized protein TRAVEDRAFT_52601 [Trametes versicolor FP-101664 SS1]|uniref:uncharacterized protein n=1 Tax=Trametes versicolor (strain FP-101664) TaxID=717944 RepID=UPI0004622E9E|nr:uncharacterized protein TRAVEDRAFT_52601 [Trametes versicolor FP-101664 SS1]EIW53472.1 hypothetical protein TRAVEDRAFT_52601 [Trametes versicolor FP-101664 SS1]
MRRQPPGRFIEASQKTNATTALSANASEIGADAARAPFDAPTLDDVAGAAEADVGVVLVAREVVRPDAVAEALTVSVVGAALPIVNDGDALALAEPVLDTEALLSDAAELGDEDADADVEEADADMDADADADVLDAPGELVADCDDEVEADAEPDDAAGEDVDGAGTVDVTETELGGADRTDVGTGMAETSLATGDASEPVMELSLCTVNS